MEDVALTDVRYVPQFVRDLLSVTSAEAVPGWDGMVRVNAEDLRRHLQSLLTPDQPIIPLTDEVIARVERALEEAQEVNRESDTWTIWSFGGKGPDLTLGDLRTLLQRISVPDGEEMVEKAAASWAVPFRAEVVEQCAARLRERAGQRPSQGFIDRQGISEDAIRYAQAVLLAAADDLSSLQEGLKGGYHGD